jgi:hypothetical protein
MTSECGNGNNKHLDVGPNIVSVCSLSFQESSLLCFLLLSPARLEYILQRCRVTDGSKLARTNRVTEGQVPYSYFRLNFHPF